MTDNTDYSENEMYKEVVNECDPNKLNDFDRGKWEDLAWLMPEVRK